MRSVVLACVLLIPNLSVNAQQATVQQPVIGTTSVGTTVSVPDRGRAFLGGVGSAQSGSVRYGPLRSGRAYGSATSGSSMSTSVFIHDLRAMDEALLNSVPDVPSSSPVRSAVGSSLSSSSRPADVSPAEKRVKYERLAKLAEEAGKSGVAKLHWQMAAKYGSTLASDRLAVPSTAKSDTARTAVKE